MLERVSMAVAFASARFGIGSAGVGLARSRLVSRLSRPPPVVKPTIARDAFGVSS